MGLIKITSRRKIIFFMAIVFGLGFPLYGQSAALLPEEIQSIEKKLSTPGLGAVERRFTLTRLARLLTLSGNIEGAADAWNKAAFAEPDKQDDRSLLEGVRCYISLGELDSAEAGVRMVLLNGSDPAMIREGRFLGCLIEAFRTGNSAALSRLLGEGDYADRKPAILYSLWKISGDEAWQTRLRVEHPASPEARSLTSAAQNISTAPTPMWFLFPGREGIRIAEPVPAGSASPQPEITPSPATAPQLVTAAPQPAAAPPTAVPDPVPDPQEAVPPVSTPSAPQRSAVLQTGFFSREANAKALADQLTRAGFIPSIKTRQVNNTTHFVVSVPPGDDINASLRRLKDLGFEAFPVY
ncbi:hypothetical protein FACS189473_0180 [Spirochaetia bacterium]|nr:hypothetical protein FACS189473_0180 [Spirochaetia bacterium]